MKASRIAAAVVVCCLIYCALHIGRSAKAQTNTITLTAKLTIKAGKEKEFETLMKGIVPKVRQEPGNLMYAMCRSKENPRLFMFIEEYADQKVIQAHGHHLQESGVDIGGFLDGPVAAEYFDKIAF
jgi:quinol monooxygenase YgiN